MIACARLKRHCQAARAIDHRPFGSRVPQTRDGPALRCQSVALFRASVWRSWVAQALLPVRVLLSLSSMHSQEWLCYSTLSAAASAATFKGRKSKASASEVWSLDLDQFQRLASRTFNHYGARIAKLVGLFEERDALSPQFGDPGIKVADAERDVIGQMSTRAHKRMIILTLVPIHGHIIEKHACRRLADHPLLFERWPTSFAALHFAVVLGVRRLPGYILAHWSVEVLLVPQLRAVRIFLVHVHVVEALHRHVALVFHDGPVGALQIREAGAPARLDALGFGFRDPRLRQASNASRSS